MTYDVLTPRKIVFGWGRRAEVGELGRALGTRALVVNGSRTLERQGTLSELCDRLNHAGVETRLLGTVIREPQVDDVDRMVRRAVEGGIRPGDFLLGIGGGAALDTAKAVAALVTNRQGEGVQDFLEGVGRGLTIEHDPLPLLVIPTTAGTGSEATKNAVISSDDPPFKKSLRSERMVADAVLIDPELTVTCPPGVTAHSGMDAITQLIESMISCRATMYTRMLCAEGLRCVFSRGEEPAVVRAVEQPDDKRAREAMSHAALLSGMALANSGLGMAHGVAAALGVHCRVPHGLACAVLLPIAMQANRDVKGPLLHVANSVNHELMDDPQESVQTAIDTLRSINARVGIPSRLREIGVRVEQIPEIVRSSRGNSMNGNPRVIADEELAQILTEHL